jgi:hypothetical protein
MEHSSEPDAVWQKQVGTGRWRLVRQHSDSMHPLSVPVDGPAAAAGDGSALPTAAIGLSATAAAAALVEELASAAQGLLPPLQSREGAVEAVHLAKSSSAAAQGGLIPAGVQQQMQGAVAHSKQLLRLLCGVIQTEVKCSAGLYVILPAWMQFVTLS